MEEKKIELNKIHNVDCLEFMKTLPDKCIDLVLTDPPYGDNDGYGRFDKEIQGNEDESINYKVLPELYRILKVGGVCYLFTNWKFSGKIHNFIETQTDFYVRTMMVIVKNNFGMGYGFRNQHELCWVLEKDKVTYLKADFSNVQSMQHIQHDKETHPHEKGLELIQKMVAYTTKEEDVVFDPFLGSGTTAVACKLLKRNYIGCEISEEYTKLAEDRIKSISNPLF